MSDRVVVIGGTPGRVIDEVAIGLGPERDAETLRSTINFRHRSNAPAVTAAREGPLVNRDTTSAMTGQREDEVAVPPATRRRHGGRSDREDVPLASARRPAGGARRRRRHLAARRRQPHRRVLSAEASAGSGGARRLGKDGSLLGHIAATLVPRSKASSSPRLLPILLGYALAMAKLPPRSSSRSSRRSMASRSLRSSR